MNTNSTQRPGHTLATRFKQAITGCALLLGLSLSSFARPSDKINSEVNSSFQKDFKNAEVISCEVSRKLTKLTFVMNNLVLHAFYSNNGELLGITRNILTSQLPINLQFCVRQEYQDFWVTDLFEVTNGEENEYYITLETASQKIILRSGDSSNWEIYKKTYKD